MKALQKFAIIAIAFLAVWAIAVLVSHNNPRPAEAESAQEKRP
jgi:hypothetical protein